MANDALVKTLQNFLTPSAQPPPPGVNPDDWNQANSQMTMKYGPQAQGYYDQYNQIQSTLQSDTAAQQQFGQTADKNMADIANTLHGQLQQGADTTGQIYQAGQQKVGGLYDELIGGIGQQGNEVQDILQKQAQRTGQDESLSKFSNPLGRIQAGIAEMKARAELAKGSSVSNLMTLGTQMQSIAQSRVGSSDQEYASKRADLQKQVQATIGKLQLESMTEGNKVLSQLTTMAGTKAADMQNTLLQLGNARSHDELERLKLQLDHDDKQARLLLEAHKAIAENDPNSLSNQLKQAQLDKLNKEAGTDPLRYISQSQGFQNMNDVLNTMRRTTPAGSHMATEAGGADVGKLTNSQIGAIQRFVDQNLSAVTAAGTYSVDPSTAMMALIGQKSKNGTIDLSEYKGPDAKKGYSYKVNVDVLWPIIQSLFTNVGPASKTGAIMPGGSKG